MVRRVPPQRSCSSRVGRINIAMDYCDIRGGVSDYKMYLNGKQIGQRKGDAEHHLGHTPSFDLDGHSAIRKTFHDVEIKKGDMLRIVETPGGIEPAPLDYVAVLSKGLVG